MVARRAHNPEVVGSNPAPATIKKPVRLNEGPPRSGLQGRCPIKPGYMIVTYIIGR